MGKISAAALVSLVLLGIFVVSMGTASADNPEAGTLLNILVPCFSDITSISFPASTDFFLEHGWAQDHWNDPSIATPALRLAFLHPTTTFILHVVR